MILKNSQSHVIVCVYLFIYMERHMTQRKQSNNQLSSICPAQPLEMFHHELPHRTEPPLTACTNAVLWQTRPKSSKMDIRTAWSFLILDVYIFIMCIFSSTVWTEILSAEFTIISLMRNIPAAITGINRTDLIIGNFSFMEVSTFITSFTETSLEVSTCFRMSFDASLLWTKSLF